MYSEPIVPTAWMGDPGGSEYCIHGIRCCPTALAVSRLGFGLRTRFWHVVIGFTQRAARPSACKPRVNTGSMESMLARQCPDIIIVLDHVKANGTGISRVGQEICGDSVADVLTLIVFRFNILALVRLAFFLVNIRIVAGLI